MVKMTVGIKGMMCGMCEAHVNDAIRNHFKVKKVNASRKKNNAVIVAEEEIPKNRLETVIQNTGYRFIDVIVEPYEEKRFFGKK